MVVGQIARYVTERSIRHHSVLAEADIKEIIECPNIFSIYGQMDIQNRTFRLPYLLLNRYRQPQFTDQIFLFLMGRRSTLKTFVFEHKEAIIDTFSRYGSVLVINYREIGNSGQTLDVTQSSWIPDFTSWLQKLQINIGSLVIWGHSLGSIPACLLANHLLEQGLFYRQLILWSPVYDIESTILRLGHWWPYRIFVSRRYRQVITQKYRCQPPDAPHQVVLIYSYRDDIISPLAVRRMCHQFRPYVIVSKSDSHVCLSDETLRQLESYLIETGVIGNQKNETIFSSHL